MRMLLNPFATNKYWWTCDVTKRGPRARRGLSVCIVIFWITFGRFWWSFRTKRILKTSIHWKNQLGKPFPTWFSSPPMGGLNLPLKPSFVKSITSSVVTYCCDTKIMINSFQIQYHAWLRGIHSLSRQQKKRKKKTQQFRAEPTLNKGYFFPAAWKRFFTICQ